MTSLDQLQQHRAAHEPAVQSTIDRLRAGETFVELCDDAVELRAATLAAILDQLAADPVKLVWTGNPLRSPLTIERLILQAAGPEADLRIERTPEQLAHMLAHAPDCDTARLVIVQQPETLDPVARETLARMQPSLAAAAPRIQLLFCGSTAFHPIEPPPADVANAEAPNALILRDRAEIPSSNRRDPLPLLILLAATAIGSLWPSHMILSVDREPHLATIAPAAASDRPQPALPTSASDTPAQPLAQPSVQVPEQAAAQPPGHSPPQEPDLATLRREFDQFLAQQPDRVSTLTPDQRDALFHEYLTRIHPQPSSSLPSPTRATAPGNAPG